MNREVHVRFWERPEVKVLRATRQSRTESAASSLPLARPVYPHQQTPSGGCAATIKVRTQRQSDEKARGAGGRREGVARPTAGQPRRRVFPRPSGGRAAGRASDSSQQLRNQRLPGLHITDHQMRLYMILRQSHDRRSAAAKAGFSTATGYRVEADRRLPSQRRRRASDDGPIRWPGMGSRGRADPEGRARHPGQRRARGATPPASGAQPQHSPHARAADARVAGARRPRAGRDLPPGAPGRTHGPVGLHRYERARRDDCRRLLLIGSIISGSPSRASSMPRWCSAARASWRSPRDCRTHCGPSAGCRRSTAATACRRRSAIWRRRAGGPDPALSGTDAPLRHDTDAQQSRCRAREWLDREFARPSQEALEDALLLRGSRDFNDLAGYRGFVDEIVGRQQCQQSQAHRLGAAEVLRQLRNDGRSITRKRSSLLHRVVGSI